MTVNRCSKAQMSMALGNRADASNMWFPRFSPGSWYTRSPRSTINCTRGLWVWEIVVSADTKRKEKKERNTFEAKHTSESESEQQQATHGRGQGSLSWKQGYTQNNCLCVAITCVLSEQDYCAQEPSYPIHVNEDTHVFPWLAQNQRLEFH